MTPPKDPARVALMMGISLDGYVAVPSGNGLTPVMEGVGGLPPEDPELTKTKLAWIWEAGAHLMGGPPTKRWPPSGRCRRTTTRPR
jgi:hypothetical protein